MVTLQELNLMFCQTIQLINAKHPEAIDDMEGLVLTFANFKKEVEDQQKLCNQPYSGWDDWPCQKCDYQGNCNVQLYLNRLNPLSLESHQSSEVSK